MSSAKASHRSTEYVALLRGINLGGNNRLAMKELVEMFVEAGCNDVSTYIQSGNVLFTAPGPLVKGLPELVAKEIAARYGYRVPVIVRSAEQLAQTIRDNPFLQAGESEKTLHVYFLAHLPTVSAVQKLDPNRSPPDSFRVVHQEIYVHLPNSMARTKLTNAYFDSKLSTTSTARTWGTVCKLFAMMAR